MHDRQKHPVNAVNITVTAYGQVGGQVGGRYTCPSSSWPSLRRCNPVLSTGFAEVSGEKVLGRGVKREARASSKGRGP